jgi:hypothetical protein
VACVLLGFFLMRVSGNAFGPEGAVALSEPLGRLTALRHLHLGGTILILVLICGWSWVCVRLEGAYMRALSSLTGF